MPQESIHQRLALSLVWQEGGFCFLLWVAPSRGVGAATNAHAWVKVLLRPWTRTRGPPGTRETPSRHKLLSGQQESWRNMTNPLERGKGGGPEQYHLLKGNGYPARVTYVRRAAPKSKARESEKERGIKPKASVGHDQTEFLRGGLAGGQAPKIDGQSASHGHHCFSPGSGILGFDELAQRRI